MTTQAAIKGEREHVASAVDGGAERAYESWSAGWAWTRSQIRYVLAIVVSNSLDGLVQYLSGDDNLASTLALLVAAGVVALGLLLFRVCGGQAEGAWWELSRFVLELFVAGALTGAFACFWVYGGSVYVIGSVGTLLAAVALALLAGVAVVQARRWHVARLNVRRHAARGVYLSASASRKQVRDMERRKRGTSELL